MVHDGAARQWQAQPEAARLGGAERREDAGAHIFGDARSVVGDGKGDVIRAGANHVAFAVSDNGPGIAEDVRARIFSPFGTTKPRGLGLGLPLARRAVVDHGGRIDVDSTPGGTTVTVTLPMEGGRRADVENPGR